MIKVSDGEIGSREFFGILYVMMAIRVTDSTPNLLHESGLTASWMIPLISGVALIGPVLLLFRLVKKYETGLIEITFELTGPFFGRLIAFLIFLSVFSSLSLNSRNYADIVITMYYPESSVLWILAVLILGAALYIAHRGLEAIGRTALLVVPLFMVTSVCLVISTTNEMNYLFLFPIAGSGVTEVAKGGIGYSSLYADVIIAGVLASQVRTFNAYRKASVWGLWVSIGKMAIFLAVYVMVFDFHAVRNIAFPYHHLTRMSMVGTIANRMEAVYLAFWYAGAALHFAAYLYISAFLLGKVIGYKPFKQLLFPVAGTAVVLGMVPENYLEGGPLRMALLYSSSGMFLLLPVVLWGLDRMRKREKK